MELFFFFFLNWRLGYIIMGQCHLRLYLCYPFLIFLQTSTVPGWPGRALSLTSFFPFSPKYIIGLKNQGVQYSNPWLACLSSSILFFKKKKICPPISLPSHLFTKCQPSLSPKSQEGKFHWGSALGFLPSRRSAGLVWLSVEV